jgi:hypothetical protein
MVKAVLALQKAKCYVTLEEGKGNQQGSNILSYRSIVVAALASAMSIGSHKSIFEGLGG